MGIISFLEQTFGEQAFSEMRVFLFFLVVLAVVYCATASEDESSTAEWRNWKKKLAEKKRKLAEKLRKAREAKARWAAKIKAAKAKKRRMEAAARKKIAAAKERKRKLEAAARKKLAAAKERKRKKSECG